MPQFEVSPLEDSLADGCYDLYVDMGTNVGIQIRKLYEPSLYPEGLVLPHFQSLFGSTAEARKTVCAFGFEVNRHHSQRLQELEKAYSAMNWRTRIFTETGIGVSTGWATFHSDGDLVMNEWAGSVDLSKSPPCMAPGAVRLIAGTEFFAALRRRRIPAHPGVARPPRIMVKMDIEGLDEAVMMSMAREGGLCDIDFLYGEHMSDSFLDMIWKAVTLLGCKSIINSVDDEKYVTSDYPLPHSNRSLRPCAASNWTFGGEYDAGIGGHRDFTSSTCVNLPNCGWCGSSEKEGICLNGAGEGGGMVSKLISAQASFYAALTALTTQPPLTLFTHHNTLQTMRPTNCAEEIEWKGYDFIQDLA